MADLLGDDRPPPRGQRAIVVAAVLLLGALAVVRLADRSGGEPAAAPSRTPPASSPTAPAPAPTPASPAPPAVAAPPGTRGSGPAPWSGLPVRDGAGVDVAAGDAVRWHGRTYSLHRGDRVLVMRRALGGPLLLVQSRGTTVLEQLRALSGAVAVLARFSHDVALPQGLAVDEAGRRVAYATATGSVQGPFDLVVRDLLSGRVVAARTTRLTFAVRDWVDSGVVLTVAADPGGPPWRWLPGSGPPRRVTPPAADGDGPFLLAASPRRPEWAVTGGRCLGVVRRLGDRPVPRFCRVPLSEPAAWSPAADRLVARGDRPVLRVVDLGTGLVHRLAIPPRVFIDDVRWRGDGVVLAEVRTLTGNRSAVLSCQVGGGCARLDVGLRGSGLVLSG